MVIKCVQVYWLSILFSCVIIYLLWLVRVFLVYSGLSSDNCLVCFSSSQL